jgi:hypothetical protein
MGRQVRVKLKDRRDEPGGFRLASFLTLARMSFEPVVSWTASDDNLIELTNFWLPHPSD